MKKILPAFSLLLILFYNCETTKKTNLTADQKIVPNIDLTYWKLTTPATKGKGKPIAVSPPETFDYANNEQLKEFMYNDSTDGSIVFYAYPAASTANSKYSRSELREQMVYW